MQIRPFWLAAVAVIASIQVHAATPPSAFSCIDLRKAAQRLQVHATNIANANTTRVPGGGPYKAIELRCREMFCESITKEDFRLVYDTSHPDANKAGYVQYPNLDLSSEIAALNSAATEVKLLGASGVCGASALTTASSALVKYDAGTSILTDVLNFSADGKLTSWSRTNRDGKSEHYSFAADGSLAKSAAPGLATAPATSTMK
ncbi:MAG: hypothetical protein AAB250_11495 [Bdellovibrionota bacterium]